ncbi:FAD-dependent thymidylate synthase [Desulfovibrio oxyclinae]|uniref:FAD-dependent thymidylate synthase n=1 Tax=Desulfovibrio oxyclinae TaxID=63560 RepID=UPI00035C5C94|nr:FAD-dependent thymidylate synthase [Desulfovibrio oxyclinae]
MTKIMVHKLTSEHLMRRACEMTFRGKSNVDLEKMYRSEHSPIRTQVFWIEFQGIPTFASVHLVRHKLGVEHFVLSNREDRGGDKDADRWTPVNHGMFINAQELIFMARMRLCKKAHPEVQRIVAQLRDEIAKVDPALAKCMVKNCEYRGGCNELKPCYEEV